MVEMVDGFGVLSFLLGDDAEDVVGVGKLRVFAHGHLADLFKVVVLMVVKEDSSGQVDKVFVGRVEFHRLLDRLHSLIMTLVTFQFITQLHICRRIAWHTVGDVV